MLGIRFLLDYGHFFQDIIPAAEARRIVCDFYNGVYSDDTTIGNLEGQMTWAIRVNTIKAIHTFTPQPLAANPAPQTGYGRITPGASGLN